MAVSFDVIVIGAGGAGLTAAIYGCEAGASVLVLEAADRTGGSLALSGGVVMAAGTSLQRAAGIEDTAGALLDRYLTLNRWAVEPSLAQVLSEEGAEQLEWLIGLGVEFHLLPANAAEYTPRSHMAVGEGARIAQVLDRKARRAGAEIRTGSRVSELKTEAEGWRVDLADGSGPLRARAVVITTGGFGQSPEMRRRYFPSVARFGDRTWSVSAPTCVGDGIELGAAVGAAITGHDQGLAVVTPGFDQNWDVVPPAWLVFVNREGQRYVNEMMPYSMLSATTQEQPGSTAFAVFDEVCRARSTPTTLNHLGIVSLDWNHDIIEANVVKGLVCKAQSLHELAAKSGIDPVVLARTIETYNADCAAGCDSHFLKDPKWLRPVSTPPFYAAEIRPCLVALTCCGLRIDSNACVLDTSGAPIPRLFAAGETTGGVMRNYGGSGNSIANALVFGRRAGRGAASLASEVEAGGLGP